MKKSPNRKNMEKLVKELDEIEIVLLMERILNIMEQTKEDIEKNPKDWNKGIIHPSLWTRLAAKIVEHIGAYS